jgi:hypothetical protein
MQRKIFTLFISFLMVAALAALAQSPTSSAPPGSSTTQDPYGATLDHPNPTGNNSTPPITDSRTATQGSSTTTTMTPTSTDSSTPAADTSSSTNSNMTSTPATDSSSSMTNNASSTPTTTTADTSANVNGAQTLPRTASELPLLAALGLLALGGALTARTFAKRSV